MNHRPISLWRELAFTALFWLLRNLVLPASRYAMMLLIGVFFIALSPFMLLGYMWSDESRQRYDPA